MHIKWRNPPYLLLIKIARHRVPAQSYPPRRLHSMDDFTLSRRLDKFTEDLFRKHFIPKCVNAQRSDFRRMPRSGRTKTYNLKNKLHVQTHMFQHNLASQSVSQSISQSVSQSVSQSISRLEQANSTSIKSK